MSTQGFAAITSFYVNIYDKLITHLSFCIDFISKFFYSGMPALDETECESVMPALDETELHDLMSYALLQQKKWQLRIEQNCEGKWWSYLCNPTINKFSKSRFKIFFIVNIIFL